jgi:hypothetical protein
VISKFKKSKIFETVYSSFIFKLNSNLSLEVSEFFIQIKYENLIKILQINNEILLKKLLKFKIEQQFFSYKDEKKFLKN